MNRFAFCVAVVFYVTFPFQKALSQSMVYRNDTSWKVFAYNVEKTLGFSGGFNNPQFCMGDLNRDGKQDLTAFEKGSLQIKTFINYGTPGQPDYRYRPQYERNFPVSNGVRSVKSYLKMEDFNCDNIPDLLSRGGTGFGVYYGYYNNKELSFKYYKDLFYSPLTANAESFESASFPSAAGWRIKNSSDKGWSRITNGSNPATTPQEGAGMAMFNANDMPAGATGLLISRRFRISPNLKSEARISFWMYRDNAPAGDSVSVYISSDTTLDKATYINRVARSIHISQPDVKPADGWYQYVFPVPSEVVGNSLYLIFKGTSRAGNNIYLDNLYWITSPVNGDVNAYVDPGGDIPGVTDVDNDGDLDFFSFNISGGFINFYKNYQKEENLPCDSIHINLKDGCWGKVYQGGSIHQTLGASCAAWQPPIPPAKTTHTGNTLCMLDYDGDGDIDYLNGGVSYTSIQFLQNGKKDFNYFRDTIISQDTTWQSTGKVYNTPQFPAAFYVDMDQDGDKDILVSPSAESASENYHCIAFYKNTGTATAPLFIYQHDSLLVENTIDLGAAAYPAAYDVNKDGKPDLLIGGDGFFQPDGSIKARIAYYENTSTGTSKSFTLRDNNFLTLDSLHLKGAYPAVGDLNNDGLDDLVVGHADGTISYYENKAASNTVIPDWKLVQKVLKDAGNTPIDSSQYAAPFIYDMDKDGKNDLLIGGLSGYVWMYSNAGSTGQLSLQYQTNKLGNARSDKWSVFSYSAPFAGKIDSSGEDYLVLGSNSGRLYVYTGFQDGNLSAVYELKDTALSNLNVVLGKYSGYRSVPAFADFDNDGKQDMVLGNILGGVTIYNQVPNDDGNNPDTGVGDVTVYPNPAKDKVSIDWSAGFIEGTTMEITLLNISGQKITTAHFPAADQRAELKVGHLAPGLYCCSVKSGGKRAVVKLVIIH